MATKQKDPKDMTWKEKLEAGVPLNSLDETKADADFNHRNRMEEVKRKADYEALKARGYQSAEEEADDNGDEGDES